MELNNAIKTTEPVTQACDGDAGPGQAWDKGKSPQSPWIWTTEPVTQACDGDAGPEQGLGCRKIPAISMDKTVSLL